MPDNGDPPAGAANRVPETRDTRRSIMAKLGLAAGGAGLAALAMPDQSAAARLNGSYDMYPPAGSPALHLLPSGAVSASVSAGGAFEPRQQRFDGRRGRALLRCAGRTRSGGCWSSTRRIPRTRSTPSGSRTPGRRTPSRSCTTRPEAPATRPRWRWTSSRPTRSTRRSASGAARRGGARSRSVTRNRPTPTPTPRPCRSRSRAGDGLPGHLHRQPEGRRDDRQPAQHPQRRGRAPSD